MPGLSNPPGELEPWLCRSVAAEMSCLPVPQPLKAMRQLPPSPCRSFLCHSCTCSLGKWLQSCCSRHGQLIISGHRLPGAMLLNLIHFSTGSWGSALGCVTDISLQSILGTLQGVGGKEIQLQKEGEEDEFLLRFISCPIIAQKSCVNLLCLWNKYCKSYCSDLFFSFPLDNCLCPCYSEALICCWQIYAMLKPASYCLRVDWKKGNLLAEKINPLPCALHAKLGLEFRSPLFLVSSSSPVTVSSLKGEGPAPKRITTGFRQE